MKKKWDLSTKENGTAKTTVPVSLFCIIEAKINALGLLLVPIYRDTQRDLKTEKGGVVVGHSKKRRK